MALKFRTFTGLHIDPLQPFSADIRIEDIAHSLSLQCRYAGHCRRHYSTAEHSLLVADMLPEPWGLHGLLHDAQESYLGDVIRPLKATDAMESYRELEDQWETAIWDRFDLWNSEIDRVNRMVKAADVIAYEIEKAALFDGDTSGPADRHPLYLRAVNDAIKYGLEVDRAKGLFGQTRNTEAAFLNMFHVCQKIWELEPKTMFVVKETA